MVRVKTIISLVNVGLDEVINEAIKDIENEGGIVKKIDIKIYDSTLEKVLVTIIYVPSIDIHIPREKEATEVAYSKENLEEIYPTIDWDALNPIFATAQQ